MPPFGDGVHVRAEIDRVAFAQPLGVADEGLPTAQVDPLVQRRPDPRLPPHTFKLGRNDARIVEDQHIALAQLRGQIANGQIGQIT